MNTYKIKNLVNPDLFFGSIVVPSGTTYTFAVGDLINTTALISGFAQYSDIYFKIVSSGALIVVDDVDQSFVDSANLLAEYYNEPYTFLQLEQVTLVKPVYDVGNSGVVDNSQKLDGQPSSYYVNQTQLYEYTKKVVEFKPPHKKLIADKIYEFTIDVPGAKLNDAVILNLNTHLFNKLDNEYMEFSSMATVGAIDKVDMKFKVSADINISNVDRIIITVI